MSWRNYAQALEAYSQELDRLECTKVKIEAEIDIPIDTIRRLFR